MGKIVGQTVLFKLAMATGLGEGKPWIQTNCRPGEWRASTTKQWLMMIRIRYFYAYYHKNVGMTHCSISFVSVTLLKWSNLKRGREGGSLCEVAANVLDCDIEVINEFEFQSRYFAHFRINTLGKGMTPPLSYLSSYGLNSTIAVLPKGWLLH